MNTQNRVFFFKLLSFNKGVVCVGVYIHRVQAVLFGRKCHQLTELDCTGCVCSQGVDRERELLISQKASLSLPCDFPVLQGCHGWTLERTSGNPDSAQVCRYFYHSTLMRLVARPHVSKAAVLQKYLTFPCQEQNRYGSKDVSESCVSAQDLFSDFRQFTNGSSECGCFYLWFLTVDCLVGMFAGS